MEKPSLKKRALGLVREVAMVMVGILLALQVNNWAVQSKERKEERRLLINFEKNLELDIAQIDSIIAGTAQSIANVDSIIDIINAPTGANFDQFIALQPSLLFNYYFYTNDGAYWEASSTGKIELFENLEMRKSIFEYYRLAGTTTIDDEVFTTNTQFNAPYWIELVGTTRPMIMDHIGKDVPSAPQLDIAALAGNKKYLSVLFSVKAGGGIQIKAWRQRRKAAAALKTVISQELKRWN